MVRAVWQGTTCASIAACTISAAPRLHNSSGAFLRIRSAASLAGLLGIVSISGNNLDQEGLDHREQGHAFTQPSDRLEPAGPVLTVLVPEADDHDSRRW